MGRPTRATRARAGEENEPEYEELTVKRDVEESPKKDPVKKTVAPKKAIKAKEEAAAAAEKKKLEEKAKKIAADVKNQQDGEEETEDETEDDNGIDNHMQVDDEADNTSPQKAAPKDNDTEPMEESTEPEKQDVTVTEAKDQDDAEAEEPALGILKKEPVVDVDVEQNNVKPKEVMDGSKLPEQDTNKEPPHDNDTELMEESGQKKETQDLQDPENNETDVKKEPEEAKPEEDDPNAIWQPTDFDVLSGRGASVNSHGGNKKFRALCFARKPEFEAGNHAAKRRIATEIVNAVLNDGEARFLKRKNEKGPWLELTKEQAILKACQVMRDYKRPDRLALREMLAQNGQARKRSRQVESTPMLDIPVPSGPLEPIIENPFGVHDHDILCGRGAFVNGHIGNQRLRKLALERKTAFDAGNYTEKRSLASEIVTIIKALDPPGRFLKRASKKNDDGGVQDGDESKEEDTKDQEGEWEELSDEKSIHKACQVMRDIDRPDRKDREERRAKKKQKLMETKTDKEPEVKEEDAMEEKKEEKKEETISETTAVEEAVAATEAALDKALDAAATKPQGESVEV